MKKKIIIIVAAIFSFFVIGLIGLVVFYNTSLGATKVKGDGTKYKKVTFVVESGSTSRTVIDNLYKEELISNKYVGYIYLKLQDDFILQAGVYELDSSMSLEKIINIIGSGKVVDNSISVTFIEGKRLTDYIKVISENFGYSEDEILQVLSDETYIKELIDEYWFLTEDILDDRLYYALEGYLAPNTYFFDKNASIKSIIEKMLDTTGILLEEHKDAISNSDYTVHQMITMASIVEQEGTTPADRKGVAGVWYNRLESGGTLGSDVTSYYGVGKTFKDELSEKDLMNCNPYNTSIKNTCAFSGLPVGPICSPSSSALVASLEPEEHSYYFFVADKNGKTYFTKTNAEHLAIIAELKKQGLWFVYE